MTQEKYAVIFTSQRNEGPDDGDEAMSAEMARLAKKQEGFLGIRSVRDASGLGITVSYWSSLEAVKKWKFQPSHLEAQQQGRQMWYSHYEIQICKVEREYALGQRPPP